MSNIAKVEECDANEDLASGSVNQLDNLQEGNQFAVDDMIEEIHPNEIEETHPNEIEETHPNENEGNSQKKMEKVATKLSQFYRRLEEKQEDLVAKRDARLRDVNVLHSKLLRNLEDKTKSQSEIAQHHKRCILTSQAVWQAMLTRPMNCSSPFNVDLTSDNKRKSERLAKELLEADEKKLKALEEVTVMLTQELEEAKAECCSIKKELDTMTSFLAEAADILNDVIVCENDEPATFISCGMSIPCNDANPDTEANTSKSEREERRLFFVEKRSSTSFPSSVREKAEVRNFIDQESPMQSNRPDQQYFRVENRGRTFPSDKVSHQTSFSSMSSVIETDDDDNSNSSIYKFPYYHHKQYLSLIRGRSLVGQARTTALSRGTAPRKRGRPRKNPIMTERPSTSQDLGSNIKRKRGRPRKYLKLELNGELPFK